MFLGALLGLALRTASRDSDMYRVLGRFFLSSGIRTVAVLIKGSLLNKLSALSLFIDNGHMLAHGLDEGREYLPLNL